MARPLTTHCTLYTAHCILHTVHCTLYTAHCTLHTVHCTLHTVHYTLHTAHSTVHTSQFPLCTLHCLCHELGGTSLMVMLPHPSGYHLCPIQGTQLHCTVLHCNELYCTALQYTLLPIFFCYNTLHQSVLHYTVNNQILESKAKDKAVTGKVAPPYNPSVVSAVCRPVFP